MWKLITQLGNLGPKLDLQAKLTLYILSSLAAGALTLLSIIDNNGYITGPFGAVIGVFIKLILGKAAFALPLGFIWLGVTLYRLQKNIDLIADLNARLIWGLLFILGSLAGFLNVIFSVTNLGEIENGGGLYGYIFFPMLFGPLSVIGGVIMLIFLGLIGFFLVTQLTFVEFVETLKKTTQNPSKFWDLIPDIFEAWKQNPQPTSEVPETLDEIKQRQKTEHKNQKKPEVNSTGKGKRVIILDDDFIKTRQRSLPSGNIDWRLPRFDILKENFSVAEAGDVEKNKNLIQETLKNFGIDVGMDEVVTGPTVSQYTLKPSSGVKLSSITSLERDLALALAASSIRLEAPIPGKSLVGVEIPNARKSLVRLRDILQTKKFAEFEQELPVALGVDVAGKSIINSITKYPHLLVAGATGSGKSIWINSMLISLLYRYTPKELQLILIDMKIVELKLYDKAPHLLTPVITEADKAINALKWAVIEMGRRYKLLEQYGKRNIADYNDFVKETKLEDNLEPLPYTVLVIDELGDLMIIAKNEVEPIVVRLTQMSRAVGIHLILGTQRPDTGVVTGLIKANVPSRIAFAVASQIDSRVILDQGGAESLLGQGDGLFMSPNTIKPIRFQGCLVEELEIRKVVRFWQDQVEEHELEINLNPEITEPPKVKFTVPGMNSGMGDTGDDNLEIYEKYREYIIRKGSASTSMLQTAFGIGYPKARKIIEQMEEEGLVGPANGSKPREVLVSSNYNN